MGAALSDDDAHQGRATTQARLACALIDGQVIAVAARLAPEVLMATKGGAAMLDAEFQHGVDGSMQAGDLCGRERGGAAQGMNASAEERFVGVDIAETGDAGLVKEQRFDLAGAPGEQRRERCGGELIAERLQAEAAERGGKFAEGIEGDAAKLARVGKDEATPVIEQEDDAIIGIGDIGPGTLIRCGGKEEEIASHAPMNQQSLIATERDEQEFSAAIHAQD